MKFLITLALFLSFFAANAQSVNLTNVLHNMNVAAIEASEGSVYTVTPFGSVVLVKTDETVSVHVDGSEYITYWLDEANVVEYAVTQYERSVTDLHNREWQ